MTNAPHNTWPCAPAPKPLPDPSLHAYTLICSPIQFRHYAPVHKDFFVSFCSYLTEPIFNSLFNQNFTPTLYSHKVHSPVAFNEIFPPQYCLRASIYQLTPPYTPYKPNQYKASPCQQLHSPMSLPHSSDQAIAPLPPRVVTQYDSPQWLL